MNAPRISVIMGIYNCAPTLAEALDSLLAQTYQDFKVIMCDDGSSDSTIDIAQSYVDRYPGKFILIRNERNMKLAATLNHCLEYADTEYVARMDGDDISLPERFETQIRFLDEHPEFGMVSSTMIRFDEDGDWGFPTQCIRYPDIDVFKYSTPHCHAPSMIRLSSYQAVGGYTAEPRVERIEDVYLWYKMYRKHICGANLQEPLYKMRDDKNAFARRTFKSRLKAARIRTEICKGLGISCPYYYGLREIAKAFVPGQLVRFIKKKSAAKQNNKR